MTEYELWIEERAEPVDRIVQSSLAEHLVSYDAVTRHVSYHDAVTRHVTPLAETVPAPPVVRNPLDDPAWVFGQAASACGVLAALLGCIAQTSPGAINPCLAFGVSAILCGLLGRARWWE